MKSIKLLTALLFALSVIPVTGIAADWDEGDADMEMSGDMDKKADGAIAAESKGVAAKAKPQKARKKVKRAKRKAKHKMNKAKKMKRKNMKMKKKKRAKKRKAEPSM